VRGALRWVALLVISCLCAVLTGILKVVVWAIFGVMWVYAKVTGDL